MRQQKTERTANRFIDTLLVLTLFLWLAPHPVKAEKFVFTTAWTAQAQFAGYYIAHSMDGSGTVRRLLYRKGEGILQTGRT